MFYLSLYLPKAGALVLADGCRAESGARWGGSSASESSLDPGTGETLPPRHPPTASSQGLTIFFSFFSSLEV